MQTPPKVKMAICKTLIRLADATDSEPGALAEPFVPSEGAEELTADSVVAISRMGKNKKKTSQCRVTFRSVLLTRGLRPPLMKSGDLQSDQSWFSSPHSSSWSCVPCLT